MMKPNEPQTISERFEAIQEKITLAAQAVGRRPQDIQLVVVTKGHPLEAVQEVVTVGADHLGENYVEEAVGKISQAGFAPGIAWHMIGHLQSRKAKTVCDHFQWLHSLDSLKLAGRLSTFALESQRVLPVLLECNLSGETTKFGWRLETSRWVDFLTPVAQINSLPGLRLVGLMTMAPYYAEPENARPVFAGLRRLQEYLLENTPGLDLPHLSMGMSDDFEVAIQEGASLVRIGTAILGPRPVKA